MQISILPQYPGYASWIDLANTEVYLNGVQLMRCVAADSDRGIAYVYAVDKKGRTIQMADGTWKIVQRRGNVCIYVNEE